MSSVPFLVRKSIGLVVLFLGCAVLAREFGLDLRYDLLMGIPLFALIVLLTPLVSMVRRIFVFVALGFTLLNLILTESWGDTLGAGIVTASFITVFFAALTTLKFAAETSPSIQRCGRFLAQQPPGQRYLALTTGGQLFGLLLNYGSISLLGNMAMVNASLERNEEIRNHRIRRMLLAIQRGFISTLPWSPLSFAVAIPTSLIAGTSWSLCFLPGLVNGFLLAGMGWLVDSLFKPRLSAGTVVQRSPVQGSWYSVTPLIFLLLVLTVLLGGVYLFTGLRVLALVMIVVPILSICWVGIQNMGNRPVKQMRKRSSEYLFHSLTEFRSEMVLLMMAGYIGTVAAPLLDMALVSLNVNLTAVPTWIILVSLVWLIPLVGQIGMNPILAVALITPVLPEAGDLGVSPVAIVVALTAGWILSGISSPFTATTMLVGNFAGISSTQVGQRWNGFFTILCALVLSIWVVFYAWITTG